MWLLRKQYLEAMWMVSIIQCPYPGGLQWPVVEHSKELAWVRVMGTESVWLVISPCDFNWAPYRRLERSRIRTCTVAVTSAVLGQGWDTPGMFLPWHWLFSCLVCSAPNIHMAPALVVLRPIVSIAVSVKPSQTNTTCIHLPAHPLLFLTLFVIYTTYYLMM